MVDFWNAGVPTLDYGNNIRQVAKDEGLENAFAFPRLRAGLYPSAVLPGIGPFRWCALSGDPEDIYKTDAKMKELFPDDAAPAPSGSTWRASASRFRACRRASAGSGWATGTRLGLAFNEMVRSPAS
jgi:urocanate hydratase